MTGLSRRSLLTGTAVVGGALAVGGAVGAGVRTGPGTAGDVTSVRAGDARYPSLVVGNNARWTARPDAVHLPTDTGQVVRVVQDAVDTGRWLTVRGGGHCYADFVFHPGVRAVADLRGMRDVGWDERTGTYSVGAGATLAQVYEELYTRWGVTVPGGRCYSVGVGGHVSGGGYGMLSRTHGLTVDHLYGVEVVVVDASGRSRVVVATREQDDPDRELWWAHTGGGGGNFGVVTRYLFRSRDGSLPRPPAEVLISALTVPWAGLDRARFAAMVRGYGDWHARNRDAGTPAAGLCSFLTLGHRASGSVGLLTQMDATVPGAGRILDDFVAEVTGAASAQARRLPWLIATRYLGTNSPGLTNPSLRGAHKSAVLRRGLTAGQIDGLYTNLTRPDLANPMSTVTLLSFGGRINSVRPTDTAAVQRGSIAKLLVQSLWPSPADDASNLAWARQTYGGLFAATGGYPVPGADTEGCYVNYADADITDPAQNRSGVPWTALYYGRNYPRLQAVKARYDPRNVFRHAQSIRVEGTAS